MAAEGTRLGTGYVSIEPDFSRFQELLGKRLSKALGGANLGKEFSRSFSRGIVGSGTQNIGRDIARSVTASTGEALRDTRNRSVVERQAKEFALHTRQAVARSIAKGGPDPKEMAAGLFGDPSEWRASMQDVSRKVTRDHERIVNRTYESMGQTFDRVRKDAARKAARNLIPEPVNDPFGIERARRSSQRQTRFDRDIEAADRLRDRLRALGSEFRATARNARAGSGGFGAFNGGISRVNRGFSFFRNILRTLKWPLLIASVGLAAQGLSALAVGAVAASSAIGPLAGSLIALPAAALAAAQAISTLKLATAGVSDAIKASLDVQVQGGEQAVDTMRQQEDATERVADAKRNLISVERQAKFAQEDLTDARRDATRELEDMREAADRSHESEGQAALSLRQARAELNRTLNDVDATGLDIRLAESDVDRARADLTRTRTDAKRARQDFRDAQKSGVEGMPQVVAAKRAEVDAVLAVKDAQRDYGRAVRDSTAAMEEQGSAATALQQKMAQLPAAARAFVQEIVGLKPKLDALRATAASGFFPGASKGLRALLKNFGPVKGIVGETAEALGGLAGRAGKQLGSAEWGKDLRKLGKGGTKTLNRMGEAAMNLADAFRHILVSAQPFLDWLGKGTVKLSEWIEGEAEAARETGRLAEFFDRVRESMELMGPILKGVGGALLNIGEAARPVGNEILKSLGEAAEGWRDWTESTRGQNNLRRYFRESKPAIDEMGKLIRDVGKAFFELGRQRGVAELLRLVRTELVPALTDLFGATTGFAADFLKQFGKLRKEGVPTFEAFVRVLAEHAGQAGWAIAKALVNGFRHASIWGKVAIGGFILSKLGAFSAFGKWGAEAGGRLGKRLFKEAAKWIAGTEAGASLLGWWQGTFSKGGRFGKAASTAGTRMGRLFGLGLGLGVIAGLALVAPTIGKWVEENITDPIREKVKDALNFDVGPFEIPLGDIAGFDVLNPVGSFGSSGGSEIPAPKTGKARDAHRDFANFIGREAKRGRGNFREQMDLLPPIAARSGQSVNREMLPRLDHLADEGGQKGRKFARQFGGAFTGVSGLVHNALGNIGDNLDKALKALNIKPPKFNLKKLVQQLPQLPPIRQRGGEVPAFATGGLASVVPGNQTGDRHVLSLNGQPVARVESKEGIFVGNRKMMGALGKLNERFPRFQKGGLLGLQRGGYPMVSGDTDFLPALGFSLSKMARALSRSIFVQSGGRTLAEQAALYASYQAGTGNLAAAPSPTAPHIRGVAADITPGSEVFGSAAGRFGMGFTVPGESWHIELLNAALGAKGAGMAVVPKLKRLLLEGPKGPLKRLGQSAIDKVGDAAQKMLDKHASFGGFGFGGGGGAWEQVLRQIAEARGWSVGDWMELVMRESGGDPSAVNPSSGAFGLGQFLGSTKDAYAKYGAASPNGVDQIRAMGKYIADRYGTPSAALAFHDSHNWYKGGGLLRTAGMKLGGLLGIPGLQAGGGGGGDKGKPGKRKFAPMQRHFERLKDLGFGKERIEAFDNRRGILSSLSERAEQFSEWASNASALTFEDQAGNSIQGVFQGGTEGNWLLEQLGTLGSLRNQLIEAQGQFAEMRKSAERMIERAKRQIEQIKRQIKRALEKRNQLTHHLRQARQALSSARDDKDPKRRERRVGMAQQTIADLTERIRVSDFRQSQRTALSSTLQETLTERLEPRLEGVKTALTGTMDGGEGFIGLKQVHGLSGPMEQITGLSADTPPIGTLGGEILNVQARLRAIREEGKARAGSGEGDSEREGLLEELLRQAIQRTAVSEAQKVALEGWDAMRQGYADRLPRFHSGGRIEAVRPGPGEVPLMAKVGESVLDEDDTRRVEEMAANGGSGVVIESIVIHEDGRATVRFEGREFEAAVERVAKRNRPMGIATAGGARR